MKYQLLFLLVLCFRFHLAHTQNHFVKIKLKLRGLKKLKIKDKIYNTFLFYCTGSRSTHGLDCSAKIQITEDTPCARGHRYYTSVSNWVWWPQWSTVLTLTFSLFVRSINDKSHGKVITIANRYWFFTWCSCDSLHQRIQFLTTLGSLQWNEAIWKACSLY